MLWKLLLPTLFNFESKFMIDDIHSCSYCCERPGCIKKQRDELREIMYGDGGAAQVCGEAYQVVGSLLEDLGIFDTPQAVKILDSLAQAKQVHADVLPWPSFAAPTAAAAGAWRPIETAPKDGRLILVDDLFMSDKGKLEKTIALVKWSSCAKWSGWIYDDDTLQHERPEGPTASFWFDVPPIPKEKS